LGINLALYAGSRQEPSVECGPGVLVEGDGRADYTAAAKLAVCFSEMAEDEVGKDNVAETSEKAWNVSGVLVAWGSGGETNRSTRRAAEMARRLRGSRTWVKGREVTSAFVRARLVIVGGIEERKSRSEGFGDDD